MQTRRTSTSPDRAVSTVGWKAWLATGVILAAVGAVAGPYVYINYIEEEAAAPLISATPSAHAAAGEEADQPLEGRWEVADGSVVGYRIEEILFGQDNTAIGRTEDVEGEIMIEGTTLQKADFEVDMTSIASDEERRDRQFHGRILQTSTYPTASFRLWSAGIRLELTHA